MKPFWWRVSAEVRRVGWDLQRSRRWGGSEGTGGSSKSRRFHVLLPS